MLKKVCFVLSLVFLVVACSKEEVDSQPTTALNISTMNGDIHFNVEVAQTPEELQKGLMYRSEMPLTNGMIFNIYPVRPVAMWMKNTQISLDILFVAPDATISMIKEHAEPLSEDYIISRDPVRAVIEIPAGNVMRYNIKVGDRVHHEILDTMTVLTDVPAFVTANGGVAIPKGPNAVIPKGPNAPVAGGVVIPKGPNAPAAGGVVIPKGPNAPAAGGVVIPKGPNAPAAEGVVIPKGPNAPAAGGVVIPKGPNAPAAEGVVIPKGPNAPAAGGAVIPKGPNAPAAGGAVIPKGPNAPAAVPVPVPVP